MCPVGTAFVDTPNGDLNHDGVTSPSSYSKVQWSNYKQPEVWPTSATLGGYAAQLGESHFAVECSGKGSCDRQAGACICFDGFTGSACQRSECSITVQRIDSGLIHGTRTLFTPPTSLSTHSPFPQPLAPIAAQAMVSAFLSLILPRVRATQSSFRALMVRISTQA